MKNPYLEIMPNPDMLREASKLILSNPELAQQQKILAKMAPTLSAMRNVSASIAKISTTYLRSLNQAAEVLKNVDMVALIRSAESVRELIPAAEAAQKFFIKIGEVEPTVADKTFDSLRTQPLNDEPNLPPEAPKEADDLIRTLKKLVTQKKLKKWQTFYLP